MDGGRKVKVKDEWSNEEKKDGKMRREGRNERRKAGERLAMFQISVR